MSPKRPRKRRLLLKLMLCGFALVFTFFLCDAALWVIAPVPFHQFFSYQPDGHIRARLVPNQVVDNGKGCQVRINRYGFRGPDYSLEKPPGTLRIEVFGGSAAFDFMTSSEEKTWAGALQKKLGERLKMPVEVINLGIAGFDSFNSKINYLYNGRSFHPDAAIFYHGWNCMGRFRMLESGPYVGGTSLPNRSSWEKVARLSQIGRRLYPLYQALRGRRIDDITSTSEGTGTNLDKPADPKAIAWLRQNFVDFVDLTRADGVAPILVTMGNLLSKENCNDPVIRENMAPYCVQRGFTVSRTAENIERIADMIKSLAEDQKVMFVDGYKAVPHDLDHIYDTVHLTDKGAEALAEQIATTLVQDEQFQLLVQKIKAEAKQPAS